MKIRLAALVASLSLASCSASDAKLPAAVPPASDAASPAAPPAAAPATATAEIGKPAPAFTAVDADGKQRSLAEFAGKLVVLEWTNKDCPFVKKHYNSGNMQALQKDITGKGGVWLTVLSSAPGKQGHLEGPEAKAQMAGIGGAQTAYLLDPSGTIGKAYGAKTTPHMYVIDAKGTLVYAGAIDDNPSANPEDVKTAKNHVRAAVDELFAGKGVTLASSQPYGCSVKYP